MALFWELPALPSAFMVKLGREVYKNSSWVQNIVEINDNIMALITSTTAVQVETGEWRLVAK